MSSRRCFAVILSLLTALVSLPALAGTPKVEVWLRGTQNGQPVDFTDCDAAALNQLSVYAANDPTMTITYLGINYIIGAYQPGQSRVCHWSYKSVSPNGMGLIAAQMFNSSWNCGLYQTRDDGTCDTPVVTKTLGPPSATACGKGCVGNPIDVASGNKFQRETDYVSASIGGLRFERHYNSSAGVQTTTFGANWRGHYDRSITVIPGTPLKATVYRHDGKQLTYTQTTNGWTTDSDTPEKLTAATSGPPTNWQLTTFDDDVEIYDSNGRLLTITSRAGLRQTMSYDGYGRLTLVTDAFGRTLGFTYDANGRTASVSDPAGNLYFYQYDAANNLTGIVYPDGKTRSYLYENPALPHALTGLIDENGSRFATWTYNALGLATSSEHAGGADRVTLTYNEDAFKPDRISLPKTTVTDALGTTRTFDFVVVNGAARISQMNPAGAYASATYDNNGFFYQTRDANNVITRYTYDARGLETSRTLAPGTGANSSTSSTSWHPVYHRPTWNFTGNGTGASTTNTYDTVGNLTQQSRFVMGQSHPWAYSTFTYTYNSNGQILTVDGPRTDVLDKTTYEYDSVGNLIKVTNALGQITQLTNYDSHGRAGRLIDPNGLTTNLTYDLRGRLISRQTGLETTSYQYDNAGQLGQITLPNGAYITYTYDAAHRLTQIQDNQGNKIVYTLDGMGNRIKEDLIDPQNVLTQTHSRVYDTLGRLQQDLGAGNQTTSFTYDGNGNVLSITDPLNRTTTQTYDVQNRPITVTDPANGIVRYGYDPLGQIVSVTDPRNLVTTYAINGNLSGNPTQTVSPDSGSTLEFYNPARLVTSRKDAKGQTTTYLYDALNRLTKETRADGSTVIYGYDSGPNAVGKLTSMTDASGTTTWRYDANGHLAGKTQTTGSIGLITDTVYDTAGQHTRTVYPSGLIVDYGWTNGKISSVSQTKNGVTQTIASNIAYQPFGAIKSWIFGNGQSVVRSFDLDGRMTANSLGGITYDSAGRILQISANGNKTYGYDNLDRLTSFTDGAAPLSYAYDATGNRTSQTAGSVTNTYAIQANSNRIASITGGSTTLNYTHDNNGSITNDGNLTFTYNAAGRLAIAGSGNSYVYNGLGQRVKKTTSAGTILFTFDEAGKLIGEYDQSGNVIQEIVYLNEMPVATVRTSGTYYIHTDHLTTPRKIYNAAGQLVWQWDIAVFGGSLPNQDPSGLGTFVNNLRFPGQYFDAETGLHYNYFRDYDPKTGRYVQSDPIGLRGGINLYLYANANPLSFTDRRGLDPLLNDALGNWSKSPGLFVPDVSADAQRLLGKKLQRLLKGPSLGSLLVRCWITGVCSLSEETEICPIDGENKPIVDGTKDIPKGKKIDVPNRGEPGEVREGKRRTREYGPDGSPVRDYDKPHQGYERPHVHEWVDGDREHPGRDYSPWPRQED